MCHDYLSYFFFVSVFLEDDLVVVAALAEVFFVDLGASSLGFWATSWGLLQPAIHNTTRATQAASNAYQFRPGKTFPCLVVSRSFRIMSLFP
jgi:hypothetical protein